MSYLGEGAVVESGKAFTRPLVSYNCMGSLSQITRLRESVSKGNIKLNFYSHRIGIDVSLAAYSITSDNKSAFPSSHDSRRIRKFADLV